MDNRGREGEKRRKEEQILNYKTRRYTVVEFHQIPGNCTRLIKNTGMGMGTVPIIIVYTQEWNTRQYNCS
jgi:hypothetical protein